MTDSTATDAATATPAKKGRGLLLPVILMLVGAAAGFGVVFLDLIPSPKPPDAAVHEASSLPDVGFVPLDPVIISLADGTERHLRFKGELEVARNYETEVAALKPRIVDVLNSYLRAVRTEDLEDPAALVMLRGQMMRRIELVVGVGRVRDLLVMEFVLN